MKKYILYLVMIPLLMVGNVLRGQRFITTTNPGGNGWEVSSDGVTWTNNAFIGNPAPSVPWNIGGQLMRGATCSHGTSSNFIWATSNGILNPISHFRFRFKGQDYPCRRLFLQISGDDEIQVSMNGSVVMPKTSNFIYNVNLLELTEYIKCDDNEIYITVNNSSQAYYHFLGIVDFGPETIDLDVPAITTSEIKCGTPLQLFAPGMSNVTGETYQWEGPNGFVSNQQNPVIQNPSLRNTGKYKVTISKGCCKKELSIDLVGPDCDKCIVDLSYTKTGCNRYTLNVKSDYVNIHCYQWQLNGKNFDYSKDKAILNLAPGKHIICYKFFGNQFSNPDQWCCNEACVNIDVPEPTTDVLQLSVCKWLSTDNYCVKYIVNKSELFNKSSWSFYQLNGVTQPSSSGNIELCLTEGVHVLKFYGGPGCLLHTRTINVVAQWGTTNICPNPNNPRVIYYCDVYPDVNNILPGPEDNDECWKYCFKEGNVDIGPPILVNDDVTNKAQTFMRVFTDFKNCVKCIYYFKVQHRSCNFDMPEIIWTKLNGADVFKWQFNPTRPDDVCSTKMERFINPSSGIGVATLVQSSNLIEDFIVFNKIDNSSPGFSRVYDLCVTVCVCRCEMTCCKRKCYKVTVNDDGSVASVVDDAGNIVVLQDPPPSAPELQSPSPAESLQIIPNPTTSVFRIVPDNAGEAAVEYKSVSIFDAAGKEVMQKTNISSATWIDITSLNPGIYMVKTTYKEKEVVLRVMRQDD